MYINWNNWGYTEYPHIEYASRKSIVGETTWDWNSEECGNIDGRERRIFPVFYFGETTSEGLYSMQ